MMDLAWEPPLPSPQEPPVELFIDLIDGAFAHPALHHPYLAALAAGELPNMGTALADFARQYRGYSAAFPQYLTAVISRLEDPAHRDILFENLAEESGDYEPEVLELLTGMGIDPEWVVGIPHPRLFDRFCDAVGVRSDLGGPEAIEAVCWREQFLAILLNGSPAEAIGALGFGTEAIVPHMYEALVAACGHVSWLSPRDTVFFALHTEVDDGHQEALAQIAAEVAVTPQARLDLAKGMHKALALRSAFWTWLHDRALQPEPVSW